MPVVVRLSGEHPTMPLAESAAICGLSHTDAVGLGGSEYLLPKGSANRLANRAGMSHWAGDVLGESDELSSMPDLDLGGSTFRLDVKGAGEDALSAAQAAGIRLVKNGRVDLSSPDRRIMLHFSDKWRLLDVHKQPKGFAGRTPIKRPFFNPISIMPRQARALVNLSRTPDRARLLDPMCGTGGLLIEAGLLGYRILASDADPAMVAGTARNLAHFGLSSEDSEVLPVSKSPTRFGKVDGIVTDPPYGLASTTMKRGRESVIGDALDASAEMLEIGSRLSLAVPDPSVLDRSSADFIIEESHAVRVHKTLTRHFAVLRRR